MNHLPPPYSVAPYPALRLRRSRRTDWSRRMVQETRLTANDLILPLFVQPGQGQRHAIASLPGVDRVSLDLAVETARQAEGLGIPAVALFPFVEPGLKSEDAQEAYNPNSLACRTIAAIKAACPNLGVMCDVALDLYTPHGHDGLLHNGHIANDATVAVLVRQALAYAHAGVDIVGPSDMMDGRIGAIRQALESAELHDTMILAYAAKYHSGLYGPYRDAVGSAGNLGGASKATYQQDPANAQEALREVAQDLQEGADWVMVKPGTFYLDIIRAIADRFPVPIAAYQVSGEYAMIAAAAAQGWIDGPRVMDEALLSLKRAGCSAIVTYGAIEAAKRFG
jgi:porphobilinogen synthase